MVFTSLDERELVIDILEQIKIGIGQLQDWNVNVTSEDDYYLSSGGMQKLAASCMLIEAIGEGVKQIDKITKGELLPERPEIPWQDVIGIRNHIAHGYFHINGALVLSTIKNDLDPLQDAIKYFLDTI